MNKVPDASHGFLSILALLVVRLVKMASCCMGCGVSEAHGECM